jgi:hypothetical protein
MDARRAEKDADVPELTRMALILCQNVTGYRGSGYGDDRPCDLIISPSTGLHFPCKMFSASAVYDEVCGKIISGIAWSSV